MGCSASGVVRADEPRRVAVAPAGSAASASARRAGRKVETVRWRPAEDAAVSLTQACSLAADCVGKVEEHYAFQQELGNGAMGTVRLALTRNSCEMVAVKCMKTKAPRAEEVSETEREMEMMARLSHKNIVRFVEGFESPKSTYLVMELCLGGEVFDRIKEMSRFGERDAAAVMQQMSSAVSYMHSRFICHRDLKPENFMFATDAAIAHNTVKLVDFGLACRFTPGKAMTEAVGTPMYMAPEVLKKSYTEKVDVWALGCILYVMLRGSAPYVSDSPRDLLRKVAKGAVRSLTGPKWDNVSSDAKRLVTRCLQVNVSDRYSAEEAVAHGWIRRFAPTPSASPASSTGFTAEVAERAQAAAEAAEVAGEPVGASTPSATKASCRVRPQPAEDTAREAPSAPAKRPPSRENNWIVAEEPASASPARRSPQANWKRASAKVEAAVALAAPRGGSRSPAPKEANARWAASEIKVAPRVGLGGRPMALPGAVEDCKRAHSDCDTRCPETPLTSQLSWLSNSDVDKEVHEMMAWGAERIYTVRPASKLPAWSAAQRHAMSLGGGGGAAGRPIRTSLTF